MQTPPKKFPPWARTSAPIASPTRCSRPGSQVAPRAIDTGNAVPSPATQPRGPSTKRIPGMPSRVTAPCTYGREPYRAARSFASPAQNGASPSSRPSRSVSVSCSYRFLASWTGSAPDRTAATAASKAGPAGPDALSLIGSGDRARLLERRDAVPVQAELEQDLLGLRGELGRRAELRRGDVELDGARGQLELAGPQDVLVGSDLRVGGGLQGVLHGRPRAGQG